MTKFQVNIFGTVPSTMEIEAVDEDQAEYKARQEVADLLDFEAEELDDQSEVAPHPGGEGKAKVLEWTKNSSS